MLDPEQKENIATLITDLVKIHSESEVTLEQLQTLKTDVTTLVENAPPDPATVTKLEDDIKAMIDDRKIDISLLKADLTAIVQSMDVKIKDKAKVLADLAGIKEAANLDGTIVVDLQAIVATAQANHQTRRRHA